MQSVLKCPKTRLKEVTSFLHFVCHNLAGIWASKLGSGLEDGIWALKQGFGPQIWDLGLEDRIWASKLGLRPRSWDSGLEDGIWPSKLVFERGRFVFRRVAVGEGM